MAWGKVDDNMAFHPKVVAAGNEAMGLWVRALSWSMSILSDGYVPAGMVTAFNGDRSAHALVNAGLWIEVDDGFQFRDWAEYQPTKEQILADRAAAKERMARVRGKKPDPFSSPERSESVRANTTRSSVTPTRPDPSVPKEHLTATKRAHRIPNDFQITNEMTQWAKTTVPGLDIKSHTGMFVDYWHSASGTSATKLDWAKAWQVWMRREFMKMPVQQKTIQYDRMASDASHYCTHGWPKGECDRCSGVE